MTYVADINALIKARVESSVDLVCFGQNISAGSCLGGLTRNISAGQGGMFFNTPNAENALTAMGFGLMTRGVSSIFFMKQMDFLLLGLDHIVNTWNVLRLFPAKASFTIVAIVVDSGFEGPQSCFNGFSDICSLGHVQGYAIASRQDALHVFDTMVPLPGFRIVGVSQRLWQTELLDLVGSMPGGADGITRCSQGDSATIASFNFALPQAMDLAAALGKTGRSASVFGVSAQLPGSWGDILADSLRTGRLVVIDDSRSANRPSDRLIADAYCAGVGQVIQVRRQFNEEDLKPNADCFDIDIANAIEKIVLDI